LAFTLLAIAAKHEKKQKKDKQKNKKADRLIYPTGDKGA